MGRLYKEGYHFSERKLKSAERNLPLPQCNAAFILANILFHREQHTSVEKFKASPDYIISATTTQEVIETSESLCHK